MTELTRFQALRPPQRISGEEKQQIGLSLYPDEKLSDFAAALQEEGDRETYDALIGRYREVHKEALIEDLSDLNVNIARMYQWLDYKARPIKVDAFAATAKKLDASKLADPDAEWARVSDNLLLAIHDGTLGSPRPVDLQRAVRIFHLMRHTLKVKKDKDNAWKYELVDGVTTDVIHQILDQPLILPKRLGRGRCCDDSAGKPGLKAFKGCEREDERPSGERYDEPRRVEFRCECKCDTSCQRRSCHCICINTYVGDLFLIRETLARYEAGDIAHIENILAGEQKVRRHRMLTRTEESLEAENETITSTERDHQVTEKFTLQSEVKNIVDQKINVDAGVTATLKYGEAITVTPHANVVANFSKSEAQSVARSYAKDVVDRAVVKVQEKMRKVQISKALREVEERNKHMINNTAPGSDHRAGIYYWVNKVSHAQVYNYGRHTMFDVIVPEPAALFKKLLRKKQESDSEAPAKPTLTPSQVTRGNWGSLLHEYGISSTNELQPPDGTVRIEVAFSHHLDEADGAKKLGFSSHEFKAEVPKGYKAKTMDCDIRCSVAHPASTERWDEAVVSVNAGDRCLFAHTMTEYGIGALPNQTWPESKQLPMLGEEGSITLAIAGYSTLPLSLSGSVSILCELKTDALEKWQASIYNLIMVDYNRRLDAFNNAYGSEQQLFQIKGRNPFINREIERNEFKRHIIAILMCDYFNGIGSMMERVEPCGYPEIDFAKLERDTPVIQFFEQVFEWEYMTYLFYHSMWARKCKWPELIDEDSGDPLFDKFLMSGAARVQVAIRPGMEDVFQWFLKRGEIWGATGKPPIAGDDTYVAMIQELKEAMQGDYDDRYGFVEATKGQDVVELTESTYYWDLVNNQLHTLNIANDIDREILLDFETYRIVSVKQKTAGDNATWIITLDRPWTKASTKNMKHAVGAVFVGAPWEVVIPTQLVYLRNPTDKLPVYPLS